MAALSAVDPTGELAQQEPGFDAAPVIAATEHGLLDFLNTPAQQVLGQLPLRQFPQDAPTDQAPADPAGPSPVDPMQVLSPIFGGLGSLASGVTGLTGLDPTGLITPVVNALGALGTSQFSGIDPTQILRGVSGAFDRTAASLQQARGAVAHDWQGASGAAVDTKTRAAVANGAEVATQADGLRDNLSTAAAAVGQARTRVVDVIDEYQSTRRDRSRHRHPRWEAGGRRGCEPCRQGFDRGHDRSAAHAGNQSRRSLEDRGARPGHGRPREGRRYEAAGRPEAGSRQTAARPRAIHQVA